MKYKFCIILLFFTISGFSQKEIAKIHIQNLCSTRMYGRGYVNNGINVAAEYIDSCFASYHISKFTQLDGYRQKLHYDVNTFPGKILLKINDTLLIPGKDYIIDPASPKIKGIYNYVYSTKIRVSNGKIAEIPLKKQILVLDETYHNTPTDNEQINEVDDWITYNKKIKNQMPCVIELSKNKLSWSVSETCDKMPSIYIQTNSNKLFKGAKNIQVQIDQKFIKNFETYNICGYIPGTEFKDSIIAICAHYDHLGMMGSNTVFPGANDNASGVAMMLTLAEYFSKNPSKYTLLFIAFTGEEIGLKGSSFFVKNPPCNLNNIKFLLNLDLAGTGDNGIQVVNSTIFTKEANLLDSINKANSLLPEIKKRGEACNSDHCPFYYNKVPCFFIYTLGGIQAYHDIYDIPETLPLTKFNEYYRLLQLFVEGSY